MGYYLAGKAVYFKNVSEAGNSDNVLIADCESEEKAHFILNRILTHSSNFIRDAIVTCSPDFHGDKVSKAEFRGRLNGAIDALNKLDQVKKSLFYGRDNNLISEGQSDASFAVANFGGADHALTSNIAANIIHGILGFATEAGELLELLKNAINGNAFDWVNLKEELGDAAWYAAILANDGDFEFEDYEQLIIKKLRSRYADKFTAAEATDRNLAAERAILEDAEEPLDNEEAYPPPSNPNGDMRDEGDMIAGDAPLELQPTPIASGKEAVEAVEESADAAFDAALNRTNDSVEAPGTTGTGDSELAKSPAARKRPFPDEHLAHQPVRPEDTK
jgi:NTP pyrophosphatase (non-canonical NTP hydrolase)